MNKKLVTSFFIVLVAFPSLAQAIPTFRFVVLACRNVACLNGALKRIPNVVDVSRPSVSLTEHTNIYGATHGVVAATVKYEDTVEANSVVEEVLKELEENNIDLLEIRDSKPLKTPS